MKVRYRVVPKQNSKPAFYVNCDDKQVTIQAADSAFKTLVSLQERLAAWYKEKNISFDTIPTNTTTSCCFAWKVDDDDEEFAPYYYAGGCGVGEFIEDVEAYRQKLEEENMPERGKSFDGNNDDEIDYADEFVPFMDAVELDYFNPDPTSYESVTTRNPSVSSSSSSTSSANSGHQHKGGKKYPQRAPKDAPTDEGMILGPRIEGTTSSIMGTVETPSVIFEGVFVGLDKRDTRTGKSIVNGSIVDDTNSMKFIKFTNSPEEGDTLLKQLKKLQKVRVQGSVNFDDRFDKDYILSIRSIEAIEEDNTNERTEDRPDSRVELHLHTKMSDKDALVSIKDLFKTVKKWGHPAVAITDHGVVQAFPEAQALGKELGVKVIYGVEGYLVDDADLEKELSLDVVKRKDEAPRYHIILLAQNIVGFLFLYKILF